MISQAIEAWFVSFNALDLASNFVSEIRGVSLIQKHMLVNLMTNTFIDALVNSRG